MKFNNSYKKILATMIAVLALSLLSGCGGKKGAGVNTKGTNATGETEKPEGSESDKTTAQPQILVSSTDEYDRLPESEKEKYEAPPKILKVKDVVIKRGQTKFTDIIYTGDTSGVKISGKFQLTDVEDISNEDVFNFEIRGSIEDNNRKIIIKPRDIDKRKSNRVILSARVICLNYDEKNLVDCSEAVVDFAVQVKETKLTDQFKTQRIEKLKKPAPTPPPTPVEVPPKDVDPNQPQPTVPPQTSPTPPAKTDDKEEPHHAEGKEDSLNGSFNTHIENDDDFDDMFVTEKKPDQPAPPPKKDKPKITKDGLLITSEGTMRPVDQAVDFPDDGKLVQATDMVLQQRQMKEDNLYNIVHADRKKYYATYEMGMMISKLGQFSSQKFSKRLAVGNLSLPKGGESPPHASHQNGTDGDFGYVTDDDDVWFPTVAKAGRLNPSVYSPLKTLALVEKAFKQTDVQVDRIFMDQLIIDDLCKAAKKAQLFDPGSSDPKWTDKNEFWKNVFRNIQHVDGHGDHMHIRIKCSAQQRLCRPKIYRKMTHCQS